MSPIRALRRRRRNFPFSRPPRMRVQVLGNLLRSSWLFSGTVSNSHFSRRCRRSRDGSSCRTRRAQGRRRRKPLGTGRGRGRCARTGFGEGASRSITNLGRDSPSLRGRENRDCVAGFPIVRFMPEGDVRRAGNPSHASSSELGPRRFAKDGLGWFSTAT